MGAMCERAMTMMRRRLRTCPKRGIVGPKMSRAHWSLGHAEWERVARHSHMPEALTPYHLL